VEEELEVTQYQLVERSAEEVLHNLVCCARKVADHLEQQG
jgi:hypothetical protein